MRQRRCGKEFDKGMRDEGEEGRKERNKEKKKEGGRVLPQSVPAVLGGADPEEEDSCGGAAARRSTLEGRSARWRRSIHSCTPPYPGRRPARRPGAPAAAPLTPAGGRSTTGLKDQETKLRPQNSEVACFFWGPQKRKKLAQFDQCLDPLAQLDKLDQCQDKLAQYDQFQAVFSLFDQCVDISSQFDQSLDVAAQLTRHWT